VQKVGDVCEVCRPFWEHREQEPKVLQKLGETIEKKIVVVGCEFCDGDALKVAALDNRE
jgi:hypothetical protein